MMNADDSGLVAGVKTVTAYAAGTVLGLAVAGAVSMIIAAAGILLGGCYSPPGEAVEADEEAVVIALDTFEDYRGRLPDCGYLRRVVVVDLGDEIRDACGTGPGTIGCVFTVGGGTPYTLVYRHRRLVGRSEYAVLIHEVLHAARGCWTQPDGYHTDVARYTTGFSDECHSPTAQDTEHCDSELFTTIEAEAIRRYEETL